MAVAKEDKILIIDDEQAVRDFLERFLRQKGFQNISKAETGPAGIELVRDNDIRLVLLDVKLPSMDGIEVLHEIKELKPAAGVIMITGYPDEAIAKKAMSEGAFDYIIKPFDLQYLELSVLTKIAMME